MKDTTDRRSVFGFAKETISSTASQVFQFGQTSTGGQIDNASVFVIRAATSDYFATGANATVTATSFATLATLSFTPSATGAYAVFVYGEINSSATSAVSTVTRAAARQAIVLNGASYFIASIGKLAGAEYMAYGNVGAFNLTTTEQVVSFVSSRTTGTSLTSDGTTIIRNPSIMVWRMDSLPTYVYGEATGRTTVACSTATTIKLTVSLTPAAKDYLIIGAGIRDGSSDSSSGHIKLDENGTDITESIIEPDESLFFPANNFFFNFYSKTLTTATHNFRMEFRSEAATTTGLSDCSVFVIKLSGIVANFVTAAATAVGVPLNVRRGGLVKAASSTGVPRVVRRGFLTLAASGIGVAAVSVSRLAMLAFAAVASGVALVVRQGQLVLAAAGAGLAAMTLTKVYQYALAAVASGVALVVRQGRLTLSVTSTVTARVVRAMTMTARAAVATVTALVVRQGQLILAVSSTGVATILLLKALIFNVVAVGVVTVTRATSMTLAAVSTGVVALVRQAGLIFAVIATGFADLWAKPVLRKFTGQAGLGIYLQAKTRWAKRRRGWKPRL